LASREADLTTGNELNSLEDEDEAEHSGRRPALGSGPVNTCKYERLWPIYVLCLALSSFRFVALHFVSF